jgi:hypothetical protein
VETLVPGRPAYVPPAGASGTWTVDANGSLVKAAEAAGQMPSSAAWGKVAFSGVLGAVGGTAAFSTGLWIGGQINKHFGWGQPLDMSGQSGNTINLPDDFHTGFREQATNVYPDYFNNGSGTGYRFFVYWSGNADGSGCTQSSATNMAGQASLLCVGGGGAANVYDVRNCTTVTGVGNDGNFGGQWVTPDGSHCHFLTAVQESEAFAGVAELNALQTAATAKGLTLNVVGHAGAPCYAGTCGMGIVGVWMNDADFAAFMAPVPDGGTSQGAHDTITTFNNHTSTDTEIQNSATTLINEGTAGRYAAIDRENCALDVSYCPGGANDPNAISLLQPQVNETYTAYISRLTSAGYLGTVTTVEESSAVDGYGPEAVTRVQVGTHVYDPLQWPSAGATVGNSSPITVRYNPASAVPAPTDGGSDPGGAVGPTIPNIVWPVVPALGDKFPFGIFTWIGNNLAFWEVPSGCPEWQWPLPDFVGPNNLDISLCIFDPIMPELRGLLLFLSTATMIWAMAAALLGLSGMVVHNETLGDRFSEGDD